MNVKTIGMVLVTSAVLTGCGLHDTKPEQKSAPKTTPAAAPSTTTPSVTTSAGSLPADFPKDVPVYPGATVTVGSTKGGDTGANFNTPDPPAKVVAFYVAELPKNGWSDVQSAELAGLNTISATKDKRDLGITITKVADGKTNITIGITAAD